jgi:carboxy-cis,cis-muconate cyclase
LCYILADERELTHFVFFSELKALAASPDTNTRAIFILAAKEPPYAVYGNPFYDHAGYGNVFSVDTHGNLEQNIQNYEYDPHSAVHGMVFDPTETYVYSADMGANKIWTHRKDPETGKLSLVDSIEAPSPGDHPRWVEIHPTGNYLYVLMESGNRLAEYVIDPKRHTPVFTHKVYPLIPPGIHPFSKLDRAGECSRTNFQASTRPRSTDPM